MLEQLNAAVDVGGGEFPLATEAQWEHACRAGTTSLWYFGDDPAALGKHAGFRGNSGLRVHPVGQLEANPWGLHDLYGNAKERCLDWYAADYYGRSPVNDPTGPSAGESKVDRGGAIFHYSHTVNSVHRAKLPSKATFNSLGLQLLLTIDVSGRLVDVAKESE